MHKKLPSVEKLLLINSSPSQIINFMEEFAQRYHEAKLDETDDDPVDAKQLAEAFYRFKIGMELCDKTPEQLFNQN